jgi:hypothetical protein
VHDSADYHNLKLSVFNDDKKTDLIGEAYIGLQDVCVPGGGKNDGWHALNYRGKYAGEINLELTYYDSRPPVEHKRRTSGMDRAVPIKRRPLPADLSGPQAPGSIVPDHARGPRQLPGRPTEDWTPQGLRPRPQHHAHTAPAAPVAQYYDPGELDLDYHPGYDQRAMPDLPQIPPTRKQRASVPSIPHDYSNRDHHNKHARSQSIPYNPHSMSSPSLALSDRVWQEEPLPRCLQPTVEDLDELEPVRDMPPLPPSHTRSAPPVQQRRPPPRSMSGDEYAPPPSAPASHYSQPLNFRASFSAFPPPAPSSAAASSHYRSHSRTPSRQSVADPYAMTPSRAHPLAHQVQRSVSPAFTDDASQYHQYSNEPSPIPRPLSRNVSPLPPRNNLEAIRHPIRTFAHGTSPSPTPSPIRKELPRLSTSNGNFFSPDDFDSFNPNASSNSPFASTSNPHSPYHIDADDEGSRPLPDPNAKIVGFDGRVIDPSDHLPVHSWAPEPEKKTPTKIYGSNGQVHANGPAGPRSATGTPTRMSMSRDVVVNVRTRGSLPKRPMSSSSYRNTGPLEEIEAPNPYAGGGSVYGSQYADSRHGAYEGQQPFPSQRRPSSASSPHYGDVFGKYTTGANDGYGYENGNGKTEQASPVYEHHGYGGSALSKEMAKIDIGGSRRPLSRGTVRRGGWP